MQRNIESKQTTIETNTPPLKRTKTEIDLTTPPQKTYVYLPDVDHSLIGDELDTSNSDALSSWHKKLFAKITSEVTEEKFDHFVIMSGSNRQSLPTEEVNAARYSPPIFSFSLFPLLEAYFKGKLPVASCKFINYLLADSCSLKPAGTSHAKGIKEISLGTGAQTADAKDSNVTYAYFHPLAIFDKNKIMNLYAQIHTVAASPDYLNNEIRANFFDDTNYILKSIFRFYKKFPQLLPANVTLRLYDYKFKYGDDNDLTSFIEVTGQGEIDFNLPQNLIHFAKCCNLTEEQVARLFLAEGDIEPNVHNFNLEKFLKLRARADDAQQLETNLVYALVRLNAATSILEEGACIINSDLLTNMLTQLDHLHGAISKMEKITSSQQAVLVQVIDYAIGCGFVVNDWCVKQFPKKFKGSTQEEFAEELKQIFAARVPEWRNVEELVGFAEVLQKLREFPELKDLLKVAEGFLAYFPVAKMVKTDTQVLQRVGVFGRAVSLTCIEEPQLASEVKPALV